MQRASRVPCIWRYRYLTITTLGDDLFQPKDISPWGFRPRVIHVTATGLVVKGGRVLLGKRTSTVRFAGMWDAFGGHLVPCEEPTIALARELEEELGIQAIQPQFLGIYEDVDPTSRD